VKRLLLGLAVVLATCAGIALGLIYVAEHEEQVSGAAAGDPADQVSRGKYLALAGDCAACHTALGGTPYAGGRGIETPFGTVYSPNLTPDGQSGLGAWSADDFWRALHYGKGRDGRLLYPAFPYPNYTLVTRADSDALFAYLRTLAPAIQARSENTLRFPYNQRFLLLGWRALYFKPGVYAPQTRQSAAWNRGAYLVQGPGHCNACHTSRDPLGGTDLKADLAGGMIPAINWYAPSLTVDPRLGLGDWDQGQLVSLLKTGVSDRGAVFGPMAEVVYRSLQHLSDPDLQAMAGYLKSLPQPAAPAAVEVPQVPKEDMEQVIATGGKLYQKYCVDCHGAGGVGYPPAYPPLAGNHSLTMATAVNPIRLVINGGYSPGTAGNPRPYGMPPFRGTLSDDEVAAVVSFIRNSWGNHAGLVSSIEVSRYQAVPPD
jgi:mono/diheme cytochrome c family protein